MLNIRRQVYGNKTMYDFVELAKSGIGPSLLKRSPAKRLKHLCHTCICGIVILCPTGRSPLNHFKFVDILIGVGASYY